jgi:hypothetical protein
MENRELIYELAKRLDLIIEVKRGDSDPVKYRYFNNKLHKLKENEEEARNENKDVRD